MTGLHAGGDEVHGLLGRAALAVDGGGGHLPWQAGGDPCVAGDVAALLPGLGDAASDHIVDTFRIDTRALEEGREGEAQEVGRVPGAEGAFALAEGGADDVDDDRFSRIERSASLCCGHSLTR